MIQPIIFGCSLQKQYILFCKIDGTDLYSSLFPMKSLTAVHLKQFLSWCTSTELHPSACPSPFQRCSALNCGLYTCSLFFHTRFFWFCPQAWMWVKSTTVFIGSKRWPILPVFFCSVWPIWADAVSSKRCTYKNNQIMNLFTKFGFWSHCTKVLQISVICVCCYLCRCNVSI